MARICTAEEDNWSRRQIALTLRCCLTDDNFGVRPRAKGMDCAEKNYSRFENAYPLKGLLVRVALHYCLGTLISRGFPPPYLVKSGSVCLRSLGKQCGLCSTPEGLKFCSAPGKMAPVDQLPVKSWALSESPMNFPGRSHFTRLVSTHCWGI